MKNKKQWLKNSAQILLRFHLFWLALGASSALVLSYVEPTFAAPVVCAEDAPDECATDLRLADPAPFAGQLLTPPLALRLGLESEFCQERVDLEVRTASKAQAEQHKFELRNKDINLDLAHKEARLWQKRAEEAEPPFYARPWFVIPVTIVSTVALLWVSAEIAGNFSN